MCAGIRPRRLKSAPVASGRHRKEKKTIQPPSKTPHDPEQLVELVTNSLDDDKAEHVTVIDLRGKSSIADHLVIASGRSQRQVGAMADHLIEKLKHFGLRVSAEGTQQCDWVLIDGGDVIVHLFRPEVRAFYNLEKMWGVAQPVVEPQVGVVA